MPAPGIALLLTVVLALLSRPGWADAVDLQDPNPRWIEAQFLQSLPQASASYSPRVRCWLEPGPGRGQVTMRVPAGAVERVLFAGEGAVPGSFDDFVWVFDKATGHVSEAEVSGVLRRPWTFGWIRSTVDVALAIRVSTLRAGGYRAPRRLAGRSVSEFCTFPDRGCTQVEPRPYDRDRGSVGAVGHARARFGAIGWSSFVSLGRAVLREIATDGQVAALPVPTVVER